MLEISKSDARKLFLNAQGLLSPSKSALTTLRRLGYVQIDTISVVERAHHHVFWSRTKSYRPDSIAKLMKQKKAFEYWAHAASILPIEDYKYCLPTMKMYRNRAESWYPVSKNLMRDVCKRISEEGPLSSKDFDHVKKGNYGWWDFKPAKQALEKLFMRGELAIKERIGFQKVFDLPERTIPDYANITEPSLSDFAWYLIKRNLEHHGLSKFEEISYLRKAMFKKAVKTEIANRIESGELVELRVEDVNGSYYRLSKKIPPSPSSMSRVHILSPFDNAVIQRQKLRDLFAFDYQIECYVPEAKRKYGYFSLPILFGDKFVGRIDCKADRKTHILAVKSLDPERGIGVRKLKKIIEDPLMEFASFNNCESIVW